MSLQIRLPLTEDLSNKGLADVTITNYGAVRRGRSYYFDGASRIVTTIPSGMTTIKNTSVCAFVKSSSTNMGLGGISNAQTYEAGITVYNYQWQFSGDDNWLWIPAGTIADTNEWHHLCCVMTSTNIIVYLDGVQVSDTTISSLGVTKFNLTENSFIEIGCDSPGDPEYLTGYVKDFRIYNHALSAGELNDILCNTQTVFTDATSFRNSNILFVKEIHLTELQEAIARLNEYAPNVDNCNGIISCESCQDSCICQSDTCQWCQNGCTQCSSVNQGCQNGCWNQSNCYNQSCQW